MNYNQREGPSGNKTSKNNDKNLSEDDPNINPKEDEMKKNNNSNVMKRAHRKMTRKKRNVKK